jgi:hypothetical protein
MSERSKLSGAVWDKIRSVRRAYRKPEETALDPNKTPAGLRGALPLAALLSTGDDGLWGEFASVLDDEARHYIAEVVVNNRDAIDEFAASFEGPLSDEAFALQDILRISDYWEGARQAYTSRRPVPKPLGEVEMEKMRKIVQDIIRRK